MNKPNGKKGLIGTLYGTKIYSINGDSNIMTGQEWLARFKKELPPPTTSGRLIEWVKRDDVVAAAKRAVGL